MHAAPSHAIDNICNGAGRCVVYFSTLFNLARRIPPDPPAEQGAASGSPGEARQTIQAGLLPQQHPPQNQEHVCFYKHAHRLAAQGAAACAWPQVLEASTAIALSTLLCYLGQQIAAAAGFPSASISIITLLTVALATAFARPLQAIVPAGEGIAHILLQAPLSHGNSTPNHDPM